MEKNSRIYVAGHRGLAGSAIVRRLQSAGYSNLITRTRQELDLTDAHAVRRFFEEALPDYVFVAAARVGGIYANSAYCGDFIRENLQIQINIIDQARRSGAKKLLFLGSSCIYPKHCPQPMKEEYLLSGALEPTNEAYAVAKIAGITMCQTYKRQFGFNCISLMPTNLYGPFDNFDLKNGHVLPALIRRFHEAKKSGAPHVAAWGSGSPMREFLHADDLGDACLFLMSNYDSEAIVNVGTGKEQSIKKLTELVRHIVDYKGELVWDATKPDGSPRKLLDISRLANLGWRSKIDLEEGLTDTYRWYRENEHTARGVAQGQA